MKTTISGRFYDALISSFASAVLYRVMASGRSVVQGFKSGPENLRHHLFTIIYTPIFIIFMFIVRRTSRILLTMLACR